MNVEMFYLIIRLNAGDNVSLLLNIIPMKTFLLVMLWGIGCYANCQEGTLDSSFGINGCIKDREAYFRDQAILKNDKILLLNYDDTKDSAGPTVIRMMPDGNVDRKFGEKGKASFFRGRDMREIAVQADGAIVLAGHHRFNSYDIDLIRLTADGNKDSSFGLDGIVEERRLHFFLVFDVAIQADQKILVCVNSTQPYATLLLRYNKDGSPDRSFGDQGIVTAPKFMAGNAIAIQSDTKILIGGSGYRDHKFNLARFNINGSLDSSFGANGKVTTDFEDDDETISAIALQPDGKIVAEGYGENLSFDVLAMARYKPNGSLDRTFADGGKLRIKSNNMNARSVAVDSAGRIVVIANGSTYNLCLIRLLSDGSRDTEFGDNGVAVNNVVGESSRGGLLHNGDIIVSGGTRLVRILGKHEYVCRYIANVHFRDSGAGKDTKDQKRYILYPNPLGNISANNAVE